MEISPFIIQYLDLYNKAIVSDLGVFNLKRINGFYETESQQLYPPSNIVKFVETETKNDELAIFISKQLNIDLEKAIYYIEKFVRDIRKSLNNQGFYTLNEVGKLNLMNDKIKFEHVESVMLSKNYFGLKPISFNIKSDESEEFIQEIVPATLNYSLAEQAIKSVKVEDNTILDSKGIWFKRSVLFVLIVLSIVFSFYFFYPLKPYSSPLIQAKKIIPEINDDTTINISVDNLEESSKANIVLGADTTFYYEIIVIENLKNAKAQRIIKKLIIKGLSETHYINQKDTSYKKISVKKFNNLDSAKKNLSIIQQKFYPKAYIETIKSIN